MGGLLVMGSEGIERGGDGKGGERNSPKVKGSRINGLYAYISGSSIVNAECIECV